MNVDIVVSLNSFGELELSQPKLAIDGTGQVKISWWLVGDLLNGAFLPIGPPYSGFEWINPLPDPGNFSDPEIGALGKRLSINDFLKDRGKEWAYVVRIFHKGKFYESVLSDAGGGAICVASTSTFELIGPNGQNRTGRHPVIINK